MAVAGAASAVTVRIVQAEVLRAKIAEIAHEVKTVTPVLKKFCGRGKERV